MRPAQTTNEPDLASTSPAAGEPLPEDNAAQRHQFSWKRYIGGSIFVGLAFVLLDAVVNANPLAQDAYAPFAPIVRHEIDILPASAIDLAYGFALCAIFIVLYRGLPGDIAVVKGLTFGLLLWFLRVVMNAAGQWILFAIPATTVGYSVAAGLLEMLLLGVLVGVLVRPQSEPAR